MKLNPIKYILLSLTLLITAVTLEAQIMNTSSVIGFEVTTGQDREVSQPALRDAKTIGDIHIGYPSSWISSYISMEVITTFQGIVKNAVSANDTLSIEQWQTLNAADVGTEITLRVAYMPGNTLIHKTSKELVYNYMVTPETKAAFPGGDEALDLYLESNVVDKISDEEALKLEWTTVTFRISDQGKVLNAQLSNPSGVKRIDDLMIDMIESMPTWIPAMTISGQPIEQKFQFNLGNQLGC